MAAKHSKLKNSGILYELLVRQIASDVISGKDSKAIDLVKKYYSKTELSKEHKLYQTLISAKSLNESKAESLINFTMDIAQKLNRGQIRKEKYNLIKEIKDNYDLEGFFKAKINNYSQYAAIFNLIESRCSPKYSDPNRLLANKITLLEHIVSKKEIKEIDTDLEEFQQMEKGERILAFKFLLEKFNKKYANLGQNQKIILEEYINNISNTVKLKEFINHNFAKVKVQLRTLIPTIEDQTVKIKLTETINLIEPIAKTQNVKDEDLISLLQYCEIINELKNAGQVERTY